MTCRTDLAGMKKLNGFNAAGQGPVPGLPEPRVRSLR